MPRLTSRAKLQEFLGMVTWLAPFILNMSENTATLQEVLCQNTEFTWNESYDTAFHHIKQLITVDVTLHHYDITWPVKIQVNASLHELGAALMQDGKPVAFASKALTATEQGYANIEQELLAIIFGVEQFHTYVYGHSFKVYTDHKPLKQIQQKTLVDAPACLQCMLLHLQGYDCIIIYRPRKKMLLADTLSRYAPLRACEIELDIAICHTHIRSAWKSSLQELTRTDPLLWSLAETIIDGWPEDPKDISEALHSYWNQWHTMTIEDGIILCGEAVLVPVTDRRKMLQLIHEKHVGITKCQLHARNCIYWLGINKDIQHIVEACETCQRFRPCQPHAPLKATDPPTRQWQRVGSDLFEFDGHDHLVIADYYSKLPIICKIPREQCNTAKVISLSKEIFSEHGIPEVLMSDNGLQYSSSSFAEFADN